MRELVSRIVAVDANGDNIVYKEISGNSLEAKPTAGICDGSIFIETDTGVVSLFSEAAGDWVDQFSLQASASS